MKKGVRRILITILSLVVTTMVGAQDLTLTTLPTQGLLPSASIHCIFQDTEGFMWYGTESGLCRDNGYQIDVFRPSALESWMVNCIAESTHGNILFGTADGLYCIDKSDYAMRRVELDSARHSIGAIFQDSRNHLWVGVNGMLFECSDDGQVVRSYPCQFDGNPVSVTSFYEDTRGTLYVMQWGCCGILRKRSGEKDFSPMKWPLTAEPFQLIEIPRQGDTSASDKQLFWVATSGEGIVKMAVDGDELTIEPQQATMGELRRMRTLSFLRDNRHGLIWTTTQDGLYAYKSDNDGNLQEFPLTAVMPSGRKILDRLCQDKEGNVYVSGFTPHSFVLSFSQRDVQRVTADAIRRTTGYPLLADRSVCDGNTHIWIWQGRQGLMLYDRVNDTVEDVPLNCDRNILARSQGGIWATNASVLYRLWHEAGRIHHEEVAQTRKGSRIRCIYEKKGDALYVATDSRLYRLTLMGQQFSEIASLPAKPRDIAVSDEGVVYIALGTEGLYKLAADGKMQRISNIPESVLSVCAMSDGTLWTSTNEGNVYHYNPQDGEFSKESLLSSPNRAAIRYVRTDGLGHVWTLTDQQVCEYAPQSHALHTFKNSDPFIDVSYFYALETIDANRMCIDGAGAIIEVHSSPELSVRKAAQVQPILTAVLMNGEKRLVGRNAETLSLAANEEDFTLELSTLDHLHASSISFAYQIEGIQNRWVYLPQGTNSIIVNNLSKGNHRLRVMATDRHGLWSEPVDVITIHREPHWWETWWAYILYILMAIAAIYGIWLLERRIQLLYRLIRRRQEVRLDEIELRRDDIAELQRNDEFLKKAIAKTEEHLSEPDYNVESLSADMCMSRITLYRRIQEQTGMSPTDFIRDIRLKKAAQLLLQSPSATIADVARKVGFATPKYFSRCFKEKFGVLPKDYSATNVSR